MEDNVSNERVLGIINAFMGHNLLSRFRSVRDIMPRSVDIITTSLHQDFSTIRVLRSVNCIQVVKDLRSGEKLRALMLRI